MVKIKYWHPECEPNKQYLKDMFPGFYRFTGKCNGKVGTYLVNSLERGQDEFEQPIPSKQYKDAMFFPPKRIEDVQKFLDDHKKGKDSFREEWELSSGYIISIIPVTEEPRKICISLFGDSNEEPEFVSEYGKLGFKIDQMFGENKEVDIQEAIKLIGLALQKSYSIGIDMFNHLSLFGDKDIQPVTHVCLGYGEELKKKELDG